MAKKFNKFIRPTNVDRGRISKRDLDIIEALLRFRFLPTSLLISLMGGSEDVTYKRLRMLWEWSVINRWAFPDILRHHTEFNYYLDNRKGLELLATHRGLKIDQSMIDEVNGHAEKDYAGASLQGQLKHGQMMFLHHELTISRFHFMLEMAEHKVGADRFELVNWQQGSHLKAKVETPALKSSRPSGSGQYLWKETDGTENLPIEPDALFSLRFPALPEGKRDFHFAYEADRGTMPSSDMLKKLRAYYHFIKKQMHKDVWNLHPIRAVLIEAPDEARGKKLMELSGHPLVSGRGPKTGLFWFTVSDLFTVPAQDSQKPTFLLCPEHILSPIWALPDLTMHALGDVEN